MRNEGISFHLILYLIKGGLGYNPRYKIGESEEFCCICGTIIQWGLWNPGVLQDLYQTPLQSIRTLIMEGFDIWTQKEISWQSHTTISKPNMLKRKYLKQHIQGKSVTGKLRTILILYPKHLISLNAEWRNQFPSNTLSNQGRIGIQSKVSSPLTCTSRYFCKSIKAQHP